MCILRFSGKKAGERWRTLRHHCHTPHTYILLSSAPLKHMLPEQSLLLGNPYQSQLPDGGCPTHHRNREIACVFSQVCVHFRKSSILTLPTPLPSFLLGKNCSHELILLLLILSFISVRVASSDRDSTQAQLWWPLKSHISGCRAYALRPVCSCPLAVILAQGLSEGIFLVEAPKLWYSPQAILTDMLFTHLFRRELTGGEGATPLYMVLKHSWL